MQVALLLLLADTGSDIANALNQANGVIDMWGIRPYLYAFIVASIAFAMYKKFFKSGGGD